VSDEPYARVLGALREHGFKVTETGPGRAEAQCPAHDDRVASLSVSRGARQPVVVRCQRGEPCPPVDILAAIGLTMADVCESREQAVDRWMPCGHNKVAEYRYRDENGSVAFAVARCDRKGIDCQGFRQWRPDPGKHSGKTWTRKLPDGTKVGEGLPYRLPEVLAADPAAPVWVVEGEKDVDRLRTLGAVAICNAEGAGKWTGQHAAWLKGRRVTIVADRDDQGRAHAEKVAASLTGIAQTVEIVQSRVEGKGADISDHLDAGHTLAQVVPLAGLEATTQQKTAAAVADGGEFDDGDSGRKPSQATTLVKLARDRFHFVNGDDGRPYAQAREGTAIARSLRGANGLRKFLARLYADEFGGVAPSQSALADALNVLEGYAADAEPEAVHLRVAPYRDGVAIDLGDAKGRCVLIDRHDWIIVDRAPVLFRRTNLTAPMPEPVRGGTLEPLLTLINADEDRRRTLVGWLVAALIPQMPHAILALFGEQGTAKSTATKLLMQLVDPSTAPLRSPPRDIRQWAVTANASWTVALDNVSDVQPWLSDLLCKAVTGDGHVDRALYSDDDVAVLRFRRVLAINGISIGSLKGDLADRFLPVELEVITGSRRRGDEEVMQAAADAYPQALGALLDLLVQVLRVLPGVRLDELPRMADFARVLAAVDQVQGWSTLKTYLTAFESLAETVVHSDQFAEHLAKFMDGLKEPWWGDAGALIDVMPIPDPKPRDWPKTGQAVGGRIRRSAPALRQLHYVVEQERKDPITRRVMYGFGPRPDTVQREGANQRSEASEASKPQVTGGEASQRQSFGTSGLHADQDLSKLWAEEASPTLTRTFEASEASEGRNPPSLSTQVADCRICGRALPRSAVAEGFDTHPGCEATP
jgi:5S rRNA maturation endonuclease (ribonuclease M5)